MSVSEPQKKRTLCPKEDGELTVTKVVRSLSSGGNARTLPIKKALNDKIKEEKESIMLKAKLRRPVQRDEPAGLITVIRYVQEVKFFFGVRWGRGIYYMRESWGQLRLSSETAQATAPPSPDPPAEQWTLSRLSVSRWPLEMTIRGRADTKRLIFERC